MERCKECHRPRITPATLAAYRDAPEDSVCWRDYPSPGADTYLAECLRVALGAARAEVRAAGERMEALQATIATHELDLQRERVETARRCAVAVVLRIIGQKRKVSESMRSLVIQRVGEIAGGIDPMSEPIGANEELAAAVIAAGMEGAR